MKTNEQQAQQLELAAAILRTGHPYEYRVSDKQLDCFDTGAPGKVLFYLTFTDIRLVLATPPDNRPLHNPDDLTAEQVGAGYRLMLPNELITAEYEYWKHLGGWAKGYQKGYAKRLNPGASMRLPLSTPWPEVEKPDPYAELKAAHKAGEVIQTRVKLPGYDWGDEPRPRFDGSTEYRIKPEEPASQLPPCAPGMKWHRLDGWKADDLPPGYRPHDCGEIAQVGDQVRNYNIVWVDACDTIGHTIGRTSGQRGRTTRPLIFQHAGKSWTWHKPGDPCPCARGGHVEIVDLKGSIYDSTGDVYIPRGATSNMWERTLGWRYAETTREVELGPDDVRCGDEILNARGDRRCITSVFIDGISLAGEGFIKYDDLKPRKIRRRDSDTFEPCSKTVTIEQP